MLDLNSAKEVTQEEITTTTTTQNNALDSILDINNFKIDRKSDNIETFEEKTNDEDENQDINEKKLEVNISAENKNKLGSVGLSPVVSEQGFDQIKQTTETLDLIKGTITAFKKTLDNATIEKQISKQQNANKHHAACEMSNSSIQGFLPVLRESMVLLDSSKDDPLKSRLADINKLAMQILHDRADCMLKYNELYIKDKL
eukprot:UN33581